MAADGLPLSDYARELSISNKRRYLEKLSGIQDPYFIPPSELMKGVFPPVTNTAGYLQLATWSWDTAFVLHNGLKLIKVLMRTSTSFADL